LRCHDADVALERYQPAQFLEPKNALVAAAEKEDATPAVIAPKVGGVEDSSGKKHPAQMALSGSPSVLFDAVAVIAGPAGDKSLSANPDALTFLMDALRHLIALILETTPGGKKCVGMQGVIKEGAEALEEDGDDAILDLGIIGAGSRVEHYEMAGYMTAISLAQRMKAAEIVALLKQSLAEEEAAEDTLRTIASGLLKNAPV
jgi:Domain of unknown function (DUF892)